MNPNPSRCGEALAKGSAKFFNRLGWISSGGAGFIRGTFDVGLIA